jgi:predicted nucleotidyltransferase
VLLVLPNEIKETLVQKLAEVLKPDFILLFGSFAQNREREDSDLDLAYYSSRKLTDYERFLLSGELADLCGRDVDLVDLNGVDTIFAAQIFSTGILLSCQNESEFIKQRMKVYSMYATLNEQRAEILENIKNRGSVFGE